MLVGIKKLNIGNKSDLFDLRDVKSTTAEQYAH